jgi:hypothetical protein
MMEDRYIENDPAPLFLAGPFEEAEQSGLRKVVSSDAFRKAVLAFGAAATLFAVVWVVKAIVFASVTASEASVRAPRDGGSQSTPAAIQSTSAIPATPAIQSNNNAQALNAQALPAPPPGDGLLAAFKAAVDNKTDVDQPAVQPAAAQPGADALLNQFRSWATEEEVQASTDVKVPARQSEPPQAVQAARAEVVPAARAEAVPLPKRRPVHVDHAARAPEPQPQAPSLLRQFGWRN